MQLDLFAAPQPAPPSPPRAEVAVSVAAPVRVTVTQPTRALPTGFAGLLCAWYLLPPGADDRAARAALAAAYLQLPEPEQRGYRLLYTLYFHAPSTLPAAHP